MPKTIAQQHQSIDHALLELDALLDDQEHLSPDRLRASVAALAVVLQAHFEHEERSHMYTELPIENPRFAQQIESLKEDHLEMLVEVRTIADLLGELHTDVATMRLRALMLRLGLHETAEQDLLQRAYNEEIATLD